jgi:hypothetical protein
LKYIFSFWGILDSIALIPYYFGLPADLREIRVLRFISIFKYDPAIMNIRKAFNDIKKELIIFSILTVFLLYVAAVGIYHFENPAQPENFADILDCDIITIHTPKNEETLDMINEKEISQMKDGVILINCARGGLYNEEALFNNLKSGKIAMAGIDVFKKEPATDHPLLDLSNIIVTAHLGANTVESQLKIATQAANNAMEAARGIGYPHALNLPIDESKIQSFVKPYLELTQKMAFLISQMDKSAVKSIKIGLFVFLAIF